MRISLNDLRKFKAEGRKFSCLTCYDASMAKAMELAEIDTILIGDSLGMAIQGRDSTLPVTVEDMAYHTAAVRRGNQHALIMTDLPFMSYATLNDALQSSKVVMQAGAQMVKVEGGAWLAETVQVLTRNGIPVCVHLGLTPQSVHVFGGYKLQARTREAADQLIADCQAVVDAGAAVLLLECVPAQLGTKPILFRAVRAGFNDADRPWIVVSVFMFYSSTWNVCSFAGNELSSTAAWYALNASKIAVSPACSFIKLRTNFATRPKVSPSMSCTTKT